MCCNNSSKKKLRGNSKDNASLGKFDSKHFDSKHVFEIMRLTCDELKHSLEYPQLLFLSHHMKFLVPWRFFNSLTVEVDVADVFE